ncbi:MAG: hypothetical protein SFX73_22000 [Kofleriaceae bacterium]|nr:hypothetical protein [Kofleriaceae bacterium]
MIETHETCEPCVLAEIRARALDAIAAADEICRAADRAVANYHRALASRSVRVRARALARSIVAGRRAVEAAARAAHAATEWAAQTTIEDPCEQSTAHELATHARRVAALASLTFRAHRNARVEGPS